MDFNRIRFLIPMEFHRQERHDEVRAALLTLVLIPVLMAYPYYTYIYIHINTYMHIHLYTRVHVCEYLHKEVLFKNKN